MQEAKPAKPVAQVKKRGSVFQAFLDPATLRPVPLNRDDFDYVPIGAINHTWTSERECFAALADYDIQLLEKPRTVRKTQVSPVSDAAVQAVLGGQQLPSRAPRAASAAPQAAASDALSAAKTYLSKLECAKKYASKENQDVLDLKIETAQEMLEEVFGGQKEA